MVINTTCLGCIDLLACNYDNSAIIDDGSCEFPLLNFDCDGNCLLDIDCLGECGGIAVFDECGECGGDGALEFYDCDDNCLSDLDADGVCDQLDNCPEEFNPNQIDNDSDGLIDSEDSDEYGTSREAALRITSDKLINRILNELISNW